LSKGEGKRHKAVERKKLNQCYGGGATKDIKKGASGKLHLKKKTGGGHVRLELKQKTERKGGGERGLLKETKKYR